SNNFVRRWNALQARLHREYTNPEIECPEWLDKLLGRVVGKAIHELRMALWKKRFGLAGLDTGKANLLCWCERCGGAFVMPKQCSRLLAQKFFSTHGVKNDRFSYGFR
ncbi:MAG: hypothetical protein LBT71_01140, partial [Azoarcus sp.]|nr:hypothetical protein [Azoarcus sp.]